MAASGTLHEEPRLGVLDGLRGVAVLLVLWYHVWEIAWLATPPWLAFLPATGFIGVQLFFFLSGVVISYPFVRATLHRRPQPTWSNFAWRRFIKIVPSYVLSIAVAYAISYAQVQPYASPVPDVLTHLLFIHTWFPARFGSINGVLWTLAVEVEFYCIFPLIWACFKRQPWITAAGMIAIAWIWRAAMAQCCYDTLFSQYEENLPGYLDIFAFGMIGAYAFARFGERWRASRVCANRDRCAVGALGKPLWLQSSRSVGRRLADRQATAAGSRVFDRRARFADEPTMVPDPARQPAAAIPGDDIVQPLSVPPDDRSRVVLASDSGLRWRSASR